MSRLLPLLILLLTASPAGAHEHRLLDLDLVDRDTGQILPLHHHRGEAFVAGTPGHRYAIRLTNRTGQRVLAVLSVDGVNAVSGEDARPDQTGYVLGPWQSTQIDGWRKSLGEIAAFTFTVLPDSYAARTGRPDNVGVIGAAVFREAAPVPLPRREDELAGAARERRQAGAPAPAAQDAAKAAEPMRSEETLGTGHGARETSWARHVAFERASAHPDEIVAVRYDSRANLIALGVIREPWRRRDPQPFPLGFVPDPPRR